MYHGRFVVKTETFFQHPEGGSTWTKRGAETLTDAGDVAALVLTASREYRSIPSGMEGFGEGICVLEEDHGCSEDNPKCLEAEYEGARRWVEKRCGEMTHGDTEHVHIPGTEGASIGIEFRDDDPDPDDD